MGEKLLGAVGGEKNDGVFGGFFKGLEKGIGGVGGGQAHAVGGEDAGDFAALAEGFEVELAFEVADLLDGDAPGFGGGVDGVKVGVLGIGTGQEDGGEAVEGGLEFLGGAAGEDVGMGQAAFARGGGDFFFKPGDGERHGWFPSKRFGPRPRGGHRPG
jgi:hypothetical protein